MGHLRCVELDQLKGLAIILVVLGHVLQYVSFPETYMHLWLYNCIYAFHMPLFFLISGYAVTMAKGWRNNGNMLLVRKRMMQLLLPFCTWAIIRAFFEPVFVDYLCDVFLHPGRCLWFLWVLFFVFASDRVSSILYGILLQAYLLQSRPKLSFFLSFFTVWTILFLISNLTQGLFASFQVFFAFPSYELGVVLAKTDLVKRLNTIKVLPYCCLISSLLVLFIYMSCYYTHNPTHYDIVDKLPEVLGMATKVLYPYLMSSSCCVMLLLLFMRFGMSFSWMNLHWLGKASLGIYAVHNFFLLHLPLWSGYVGAVLVTGLLLTSSYLLVNFLLRNKYVALLTLGKLPC